MTTKPSIPVGGQALVEGVMFQGRTESASAIRRKDGSIETFNQPRILVPWVQSLKRVPFLRGIVALYESLKNGSAHMTFASDRYDVDPSEDEVEKPEQKQNIFMVLMIAIVGVISYVFGKLIFNVTPALLAAMFQNVPALSGHVIQNLLEGGIKLVLLLSYLYLISLTPLIKRVFQYHGAEHKVINCYESGRPVTVENVRTSSRLHYRCGSSFILFTVFVGIGVYMIVPIDPLWVRLVSRIALLPVVIGISFEVLQFTNRFRDHRYLSVLGKPGLSLQLLTTREPNDEQIRVAIEAFETWERAETIQPAVTREG
ncbi:MULTISPECIES: DUF1385 domain-containing protein [Exiguobacterium]|uniref:Predicted metal-dependent enzyme n=1 Tax=Exiguobacterium aurantiacum TaxID=33987 RepID=A0A377FSU3_9BACL|nr:MULTISPECIES: DUF1385 domain-containing protein [Exiguobacterium]STO07879.1 Predicted metal-dependent enzyme [Exiguobacterium aurantiacum]